MAGWYATPKRFGVPTVEWSTTYTIPLKLDQASCSSSDTLRAKTFATNTRAASHQHRLRLPMSLLNRHYWFVLALKPPQPPQNIGSGGSVAARECGEHARAT